MDLTELSTHPEMHTQHAHAHNLPIDAGIHARSNGADNEEGRGGYQQLAVRARTSTSTTSTSTEVVWGLPRTGTQGHDRGKCM